MKKFFLYLACLYSLTSLAQDSARIKQIDSIVNLINHSNYQTQTDSVKQDPSQLGLTMVKYLTISRNGRELKKYINDVNIIYQQIDSTRQIHAISTFYFDNSQLIKVDESSVEGNTKKDALWYFADGKLIHYTLKDERSPERAQMLLNIAKDMLEKFGSK